VKPAQVLSHTLLHAAFEVQASDIHFYPFKDHTDIYFRVHGRREFYQQILNSEYQLLLTYYKFTSKMDIGENRRPQNGAITYQVRMKKYALRLSTLPVSHMESLAIRILPQQDNLTLDELFLFPNQSKNLKKWMSHHAGIILLTGPTGSGKSTTLYALLESVLDNTPYQTITLEDPIEKDLPNILQVQVNEKAGITYQTGLKAALRHDPDILMIGEIRDKYTARFAFDAALTGHLVLSTLHAKNAIGTIHRLREIGISQSDLEQSLIAIAAIELLPLEINHEVKRRTAILEMLDDELLEKAVNGQTINHAYPFQSFSHLRKKAYAYGFISEKAFQEHAKQTDK